jgi:hypothetical protein
MYWIRPFLFVALLVVGVLSSMAQPVNDLCSSAADIQSLISQTIQIAGPFSNEGATGNDLDIAGVTGCWLDDLAGNADGSSPQIDATVWFRFEGFDGTLMLYVQQCDSNLTFLSQDTQMALYTGECDTLELVACNEDLNAPSNYYWSGLTTGIQSGNTYYLAVDGFNYSGFGSPEIPLTTGQFCLSNQEPQVSVPEIIGKGVDIYPNPSDGFITIDADSHIHEVTVFDVAGACYGKYSNSGSHKLQSFQLPEVSGFYLIHVRTDHGVVTRRVIRN